MMISIKHKKSGWLVRSILILLCMSASCTLQAQSWSEFFKQKKTQIKYLTQQIAALQVYIGYIEKGYWVTRDGLELARDLNGGEFSLHKDYFGSLSGVSGVVSKDQRIDAVERMESELRQTNRRALHLVDTSHYLDPEEKDYIRSVWLKVLTDAKDFLDELHLITTSGNYQMTDAERLKRIDLLYRQMQNVYGFARHFYDEVQVYSAQKEQEHAEATATEKWYHNKNSKP